ncbi:DUF6520 family protein [Leeuwenhoekiella polynyae]|uniref:Uncharacterized protein n=1 Tax=Leeuwenhoekiella polynyae TaxID=1550906 RepID=A0A4Q0P5T5_9FLAO|nr:DUF6520 family protein [Leeuwenhoekiella polynyae]RXG20999.1 hypothetical protein DSM02_2370 [Leeuwenhoekiella polynyae]
MKTHVLKLGLPVMAMAFGVLSAFGTAPKADTSAALVQGYVDTALCQESRQCSTINNGPICTDLTTGHQVFGKVNPEDPTCEVVLYEPMQ